MLFVVLVWVIVKISLKKHDPDFSYESEMYIFAKMNLDTCALVIWADHNFLPPSPPHDGEEEGGGAVAPFLWFINSNKKLLFQFSPHFLIGRSTVKHLFKFSPLRNAIKTVFLYFPINSRCSFFIEMS